MELLSLTSSLKCIQLCQAPPAVWSATVMKQVHFLICYLRELGMWIKCRQTCLYFFVLYNCSIFCVNRDILKVRISGHITHKHMFLFLHSILPYGMFCPNIRVFLSLPPQFQNLSFAFYSWLHHQCPMCPEHDFAASFIFSLKSLCRLKQTTKNLQQPWN